MGRKPRVKKDNPATSSLLAALQFIEAASKEIGTPNETHCRLDANWAVIFNGIVGIGHKIDSDIRACPHLKTLITALTKCKDTVQITQLDNNRLSVKSGRFQAYVPCIDIEVLNPIVPDLPIAAIDDRVKVSLATVGVIAKENAQRVLLASVMLRSGSAIATDGVILMESWHGIDLPPLTLPKTFVTILSKIDKKLNSFGVHCDELGNFNSATFYFEDGSWVKSQLYVEPWPHNLDSILNTQATLWPIPAGLPEAIETIAPFATENHVYFDTKHVRTNRSRDKGAICEIEGTLPLNIIFNMEYLKTILQHAKQVDWLSDADLEKRMSIFYGDKFRALLMQIKIGD